MSLSTQPYKGARDFYPDQKRLQKHLFSVMRQVVEGFGYQEYDAPIIEPLELYQSKTSEEIISEQTYNFTDRGGRKVTLRPEMTPSVSRMVAARRQELSYPLRLYSIPNLWRYERPQKGRLREHWQLNVDLFGIAGIEGDHEVIVIADQLMVAFGAPKNSYVIRLNSRQLTNFLFKEHFGLSASQVTSLTRLVDKMHRLAESEFLPLLEAILTPTQRETDLSGRIHKILRGKSFLDLPQEVSDHPAAQNLIKLINQLQNEGRGSVVFDITLVRGFDYYTDVVFEVFDTSPANNRSMFGGGRYDGLVAMFGVEQVATIGFGMGDVTLQNFLETHRLTPKLKPETDVLVALIGNTYFAAQPVLAQLRAEGIRVSVDSSGRKLDRQIKAAAKSGIKYLIPLGEKELSSQRYKLKNLIKNTEEEHGLERIIAKLAGEH
jgi:histidyl-tRNA synthetase